MFNVVNWSLCDSVGFEIKPVIHIRDTIPPALATPIIADSRPKPHLCIFILSALIPISVRFYVFHILMAPPPLIFQAIAI